MSARLSALLALALGTASLPAEDYFPPPDREGGWRTAATAEDVRKNAGLDPVRLERAWTVTERATQHAGLLVVRHGWLAFEKYVGKARRDSNPDMASTGKAYTSIACGIMLAEKKDLFPEGLATKVFTEKYLPEALPLDDPRRSDITLGHLLCMTAGYNGEGGAPSAVVNGVASALQPVKGQDLRDLDGSSIRAAMWAAPGAGYSYASPAPHVASIVLRRATGQDLRDYLDEKLAKPMGWGEWNYCLYRGNITLPHANGAGSIAVHSTDALRFGWCLAKGGRWQEKQLVPADYVALCHSPSPFDPHAPYSLMFEHNADGHAIGAPRDAFWKSGAGGFGLLIVPSFDLVIYKMGGNSGQYDPSLTKIDQPGAADTSRDDWKPIPRGPFNEGSLGGDDGLRRVLELVCAAVVD